MVSELTERQLDLATADIYMWCASTPSSKNDTEDSDGDGSIRKGLADQRIRQATTT
ncbi:MAG: hypothetical protein ACLRTD_22375 [Bacteroides sp.]